MPYSSPLVDPNRVDHCFLGAASAVVKLAFTAADGVLGELLGLKKCLGCCCRRNRKVAPNRAVKDIATAIQLTSGEDGALEGESSLAFYAPPKRPVGISG